MISRSRPHFFFSLLTAPRRPTSPDATFFLMLPMKKRRKTLFSSARPAFGCARAYGFQLHGIISPFQLFEPSICAFEALHQRRRRRARTRPDSTASRPVGTPPERHGRLLSRHSHFAVSSRAEAAGRHRWHRSVSSATYFDRGRAGFYALGVRPHCHGLGARQTRHDGQCCSQRT